MSHWRLISKNLIGNIDIWYLSSCVIEFTHLLVSKAAKYYVLLFRQTIITYTIIFKNSSTEFCNDFEEYLTLSWWRPLSYRNQSKCRANQWTGFYMITASVMRKLNGHFLTILLYKSVVCQTLFRNISWI